jgi:hypothetical protein
MRDSELLYLYDVQKRFTCEISLNQPIKLTDIINGNVVAQRPIFVIGQSLWGRQKTRRVNREKETVWQTGGTG